MSNFTYLSPHLDDAALSCGGQIALQTRAGAHVCVVTAFAGDPPSPSSPFAQAVQRRWELGDDALAVRRAEDVAALAQLGAEVVHWDVPDCIYRRGSAGEPLYPTEDSLWGALHPEDEALAELLARKIAMLPGADALYAPLGAGAHVDHRLLRRAAETAGRALVFYEEYPYAQDPAAVTAQVGPEWLAEIVPLDEEALAVKIKAVACYRSQISTFWRDVAEMAERLRAYALRVGDGQPAERRWRRTIA